MKMLVVPLVFCSLVCGSMAIGDTQKLGSVGVRTILFYLVTTALAVAVALTVGNLLNPGMGLDMSTIQTSASSVENMEAASLPETLLNIIPDNPFKSLANGEMLQVIVFALIIGVILLLFANRKIRKQPYILVVSCKDEAAEQRITEILAKVVEYYTVKSKTVNAAGIEFTAELRTKDAETAFVNRITELEGVGNATLVSYNGEYMG